MQSRQTRDVGQWAGDSPPSRRGRAHLRVPSPAGLRTQETGRSDGRWVGQGVYARPHAARGGPAAHADVRESPGTRDPSRPAGGAGPRLRRGPVSRAQGRGGHTRGTQDDASRMRTGGWVDSRCETWRDTSGFAARATRYLIGVASGPPTRPDASGSPQHAYRRHKRRRTRARAPRGSGREVAEGPPAPAPPAQSRKRGVPVNPRRRWATLSGGRG